MDEGNLRSLSLLGVEQTAVDVVQRRGRELVVVRGDELHTDFIEIEGRVGVVRDDDAHWDKRVPDVGKAEEVAVIRPGAGIDCHGDVFVGVGIEGWILICRVNGRGLLATGKRRCCEKYGGRSKQNGSQSIWQKRGLVGLHEQVDYHLRWRTW